MNIVAKRQSLSGHITVPGSKSHTIRALILSTLAEGTSHISNPLPSADCKSTANAIPLIGANVTFTENEWIVKGAGKNLHLPQDVVNVGNSGSLLYFLAPIAATQEGWSVFTGDQSIRKRPVDHVVDVLKQLGAEAYIARPGEKGCPLIVKGPISTKNTVHTPGSVSSQYITGLMMAALLMKGSLNIELSDPKETPYLTMTQKWLEKTGAKVFISPDFKKIQVTPPESFNAFDSTIPSDWEGVAFPLIAALLTDSDITVENIDSSGTQGDDAIVSILTSIGADIEWNKEKETLRVRGGKKSRNGIGRLSTEKLEGNELHINISGFPDAVCALAVTACFTEGTTVIEDAAMCRKKETDRLSVLVTELTKLGASVEAGDDFLVIHGHSPLLADGSPNPRFNLHGTTVESYDDHRMAMSLSCLGLALNEGERVIVKNAECCSVSFPGFYESMNSIGAEFVEIK